MVDSGSFVAKTSFFDDVLNEKDIIPGPTKLWLSPKEYDKAANQLAFHSDEVLVSGYIAKKCKKSSDFKSHFYALSDDRIVRYKVFFVCCLYVDFPLIG